MCYATIALAMTTLSNIASRQEAYSLQHGAYSTNLKFLIGESSGPTSFFLSRNGGKTRSLNENGDSIYKIELLETSTGSFSLNAITVGFQAKDKNCQRLMLNSTGQRTATSWQGKDARNCWN